MNKDVLRRLLGKAFQQHAVPETAADQVIERFVRARGRNAARELEQARSPKERVRVLALLLLEAVKLVTGRDPRLLAELSRRLEAFVAAPETQRLERLAELTAKLLAALPQVPAELLERLLQALPAVEAPQEPTDPGSSEPPTPPNSGSDNEEDTMPTELEVDVRGLPPALQTKDAQRAYIAKVKERLGTATGGLDAPEEALAYAVGKLLRSGQFDANTSSFYSFVKQTWDELTSQSRARTGMVAGLDVVKKIVKLLAGSSNGVNVPAKKWTAQQLAFIYEKALETLQTIAPEDSGFATRVDRAFLDYASGDIGFDGFDLPDLDATSEGDIVPANMIAAGRLYGALEFERMRMIQTVDRIAELWRAGVLPIGNDSGGQLLNDYFWGREDRLPAGARSMIFGRMFGAQGTETTKDSRPNASFEPLMQRFFTNVAMLLRLLEENTVISAPGESRTFISENVRKTGRELAANLSLYGWGSVHFDAGRIDSHIAFAFKILSDSQVQSAFAATTPWQALERAQQQEYGTTPSIVKCHTRGVAGRRVIEILAQNPQALAGRGGEFHDVLGPALWAELSRSALAWLSVNGTTSEQLVSMAKPVDAIASPSIPSLPSQPASPNVSQIRDLVASGQMPSLDQLQRMFN
jgi:hypothetical protein